MNLELAALDLAALDPTAVDPDLARLAALLPAAPEAGVLTDPDRLGGVLALGLHDPESTGPRVAALLERLARDLEAPVALLNGVLSDVVVLAGEHGVDGWLSESRATPLEWSPCLHVVRTGLPFVATDMSTDPLTRDSPLVLVDGLRAYAGVPVQTGAEGVVGALCVLDGRPRDFGAQVVERLQAAAAEALLLLAVPAQCAPAALPLTRPCAHTSPSGVDR